MKRVSVLLAMALLATTFLVGCGKRYDIPLIGGMFNNPNDSICEQREADICKQFDLDYAVKIIKLRLATKFVDGDLTGEEALALADKAEQFIITKGITIGDLVMLVAKNYDGGDIAMFVDALGVDLTAGSSSTYMLNDEDRDVLLLYLNQLRLYIKRYA